MRLSTSLASRALLAIVLMVGFYDGLTPELLPDAARDLEGLAERMKVADGVSRSPEQQLGLAHAFLGSILDLALYERGFRMHALPGEPVLFSRDGITIETFEAIGRLKTEGVHSELWNQRCSELGISGMDLGAVAARFNPPPDPALAG